MARDEHKSNQAPRQEGAKDDAAILTALDTSLLSLKTVSRVSLSDMLSQVWKLEDVLE